MLTVKTLSGDLISLPRDNFEQYYLDTYVKPEFRPFTEVKVVDDCLLVNVHPILPQLIPHINWTLLSANPAAVPFLSDHLDEVDWMALSSNPAAISLLEQNLDRIDWSRLSLNPSAVRLLEENIDKVDWEMLSLNPAADDLIRRYPERVDYHSLAKYHPNAFTLLKDLHRDDDEDLAELLVFNDHCRPEWVDFADADTPYWYLSCLPQMIPFLSLHPNKVDKRCVCVNPAALELIMELDELSIGDLLSNTNPEVAVFLADRYPRLLQDAKKNYPMTRMSVRPGAIELLKRNPQEVDWNEITGNPAAIDFIEQNEDRVTDWSGLAKNKNAERLIPKYINRIPSRVYPELCKFKSVICPDMKDF